MFLGMPKNTSFDGDLTDQEALRAKLADIESEIEEQERERKRVEDEIERVDGVLWGLERLRDGLLVLLGDKKPESDQARFDRMEKKGDTWQHWLPAMSEEQRGAATIQAQVENLVTALGRHVSVSASDLLEHLPAGTKSEAVNYALWRAADKGRIRRISRGMYAPNATPSKTSSKGR
jgi:hypothetical protein